jgi:hypothetical protein
VGEKEGKKNLRGGRERERNNVERSTLEEEKKNKHIFFFF